MKVFRKIELIFKKFIAQIAQPDENLHVKINLEKKKKKKKKTCYVIKIYSKNLLHN